jgi:hypothetical protein
LKVINNNFQKANKNKSKNHLTNFLKNPNPTRATAPIITHAVVIFDFENNDFCFFVFL